MRVIAGERKGLRLFAPRGRWVRPTADRGKQVLFDVLGSDVRGRQVLDLYAGSGSLGIEALSRGARTAVFVERDPRALSALRRNLEAARYQDRAEVIAEDVEKVLCRWPVERHFDVVLADPPYGDTAARLLELLDRFQGLTPDAIVVIEHGRRDDVKVRLRQLHRSDQRILGDTVLTFFRRAEE